MANILIIDDDKHYRYILKKMLETAGYQVHEAINGKDGLKLYTQVKIDVVITDIYMPEKDGIEVINELKKLNPESKIIGISAGIGADGFNIINLAKAIGADYGFLKPIDKKDLLQAIEQIMSDKEPTE